MGMIRPTELEIDHERSNPSQCRARGLSLHTAACARSPTRIISACWPASGAGRSSICADGGAQKQLSSTTAEATSGSKR